MKGIRRAIALLLATVLCLSALSGCSLGEEPTKRPVTKLTVGYAALDGKYSPFYASSEADRDVVDMTQLRLLSVDRNGQVVTNGIKGETIAYSGTDYTYTGPADVVIITHEDGTVDYQFTLRQDLRFSDGKPLTANDVVFTMYVLCDPTYDGPVDFASLPISGLSNYRRGMTAKWKLMMKDTPSSAAEGSPDGYYTAAEAMAFWATFNRAGEAFAKSIVDSYLEDRKGSTVQGVAALLGYTDLPETAQAIDLFNAIVDRRGYDVKAIDREQKTLSFEELLVSYLDESQRKGVKTGDAAREIAGIKKTGTYSFTVTLDYLDANALSQFCFAIAPLHHYGNSGLYNEQKNMFGFHKGDLSSIRRKNSAPLGAGPYYLTHQWAGLVGFKANDTYYRGRPQIDEITFRKSVEGNKIAALQNKELGLSVVDLGTEATTAIERANGGVLNGDVMSVRTVDDTGFGYLGMAADGVKVGEEPDSEASRHLRTGLLMAFSHYRQLSMENHYGSLITLPGLPFADTDELYMIDAEGQPLNFLADPTEDRDALVRETILGHLNAAGYTVENGKVIAAPEGASLKFTVVFGGSGGRKHPAYLMLTKAQELLGDIGIRLLIEDASSESNVRMQAADESGKIWCVERRVSTPADMYTYYFSGDGTYPAGGAQYLTEITDEKLNALLLQARAETDEAKRLKLYAACADLVKAQAVELPLYHRRQAVVVRSDAINAGTLAKDMTGYYGWIREIESLRVAG